MKTVNLKTGIFIIALFVAVTLTAAPSFARMGGGSGGGSNSDGGSSMGGGGSTGGSGSTGDNDSRDKSGSMARDDGSDRRMMDSGERHFDVGSMPGITTGGVESGDMTMDIRPLRYRDGRLEFKYKANTHSVKLGNYDLMKLSTLEADGMVYSPTKADRMKGHHASGRIVFEVPERPDRFRVIIRDIPMVEERSYDWN